MWAISDYDQHYGLFQWFYTQREATEALAYYQATYPGKKFLLVKEGSN